jgi:Flp pilus assembly pilin Flp
MLDQVSIFRKKNDPGKNPAEKGASMVEFALLIALVAVMGVASTKYLGEHVQDKIGDAGEALETAIHGSDGQEDGDGDGGWN